MPLTGLRKFLDSGISVLSRKYMHPIRGLDSIGERTPVPNSNNLGEQELSG